MPHLFPLSQLKPQEVYAGGARTRATKSNFPELDGMSFYRLSLQPNGIREPHWHANADELGYCLKGKLLISFYATNNYKQSFIVGQGEAFFIPSGTLHAVENIGEEIADLILQFSHEEPEDFGLSSMFGMFSDAVLGNTWGVSKDVFKPLKRSLEPVFIAERTANLDVPGDADYTSLYRYDLQNSPPLVSNQGGSAKIARGDVWPILKRQALYSLHLTGTGMREPHWHPETAEMGFVYQGKGRMSILSPNGKLDTYEMNAGDLYFIPKAYPHHIENLGSTPLDILIFFNQAMPADIGLTASVKSFPNELLTSVFSCEENFFKKLPTYYKDLFIVNKINFLDK